MAVAAVRFDVVRRVETDGILATFVFLSKDGWSRFTTKRLKPCKAADAIRASLCLIGKFLEWVNSIAEQLNPEKTWTLVLAYAFRKLLRLKPNRGPIPALIPA